MSRRVEMIGRQFGRLTVVAFAGSDPHNGNALWQCRCACGNAVVADGYRLRRGITTSCGCRRREVSRDNARHNPAFIANIGNGAGFGVDNGTSLQASLVKRSTNRSGVPGVSYDKASDCWIARMMIRGQYVLNKALVTREEAIAARRQAEAKYLKPKVQQLMASADETKTLKKMLSTLEAVE